RLEGQVRSLEHRREVFLARRTVLEETPGSRFLKAHPGRAVGLLRDLVTAEDGFERALAAAMGPLADAVVYDDAERALADAGEGERGRRGAARRALRGRRGHHGGGRADGSARLGALRPGAGGGAPGGAAGRAGRRTGGVAGGPGGAASPPPGPPVHCACPRPP